ncbi:hypothetical protein bhDAH_001046 (plasmid) [Borrelia hermsii DAH]|nr:hypothetical protein bhDAH_001046 [Borrelia hermsii DAH]
MLNETRIQLENEGYDGKQLEIQNVYKQYKEKPRFIIKNNKYSALEKIIGKLKNQSNTLKITQKKMRRTLKTTYLVYFLIS